LKVLILVLAWRLSKESLRNGHLHNKTLPIRVAPNRRRHGDGLKRRVRQSLVRSQACAQDLARTPPPAFPFLHINLSKSNSATPNPQPANFDWL
jgi:hypothetical protein